MRDEDGSESGSADDFSPGRLIAEPKDEPPPDPPEFCPLPGAEPASAPSPKPEDVTWGDWVLTPDKPLRHRHEVLAHLAAAGATNGQIAKDLGLTPSRVSVLLSNTKIKDRIAQIRDKHWGANIQARFQNALPKAMDVIEEVLTPPPPGGRQFKDSLRVDTAKWVAEKVTGKAVQSVNVSGNLLGQLLERIDQKGRERTHETSVDTGAGRRDIIDVTPGERAQLPSGNVAGPDVVPAPRDSLADFVAEHVPRGTKVGNKSEVK